MSAWKAVLLFGAMVSVSLFATAFQLVMIRSAISEDAKRIAELEYLILKAQDELRALEVTVEDAVQPDVLQARIGDRLRLPHEGQVIRVRASELNAGDADFEILTMALLSGKEDA